MAEAREIHLNVKFEDEQPYAPEPLSIHLNVDDAPEQAWPPKPLYVNLNPQIMNSKTVQFITQSRSRQFSS